MFVSEIKRELKILLYDHRAELEGINSKSFKVINWYILLLVPSCVIDDEEGISIGICASDSAPTNVKCNKDKSDRCVSIRISKSPLRSCSNKLAKYFPPKQQSYEMKGCWNSDFDNALDLMTNECGAKFEHRYSCEGSLCNKDPDPPVILSL